MNRLLLLFLLTPSFYLLAQHKRILLKNAQAHIGNGTVIENSYVAFKEGKIDLVVDARMVKLDVQAFDTIIDVAGKHIYPGLIAPNCILGLQEAEAIRPTSDYAEVGQYNPHIRSLIAYNAESKILETIKTNGVLYTQSTPRNGTVSGQSSVLATEGWNWEDAVLKADDGIHINFPTSIVRKGWWAEPEPSETNNKYQEQLNDLTAFFEHAKSYFKTESIIEINLRYEAMKGLFDGSKRAYFHADYAKDIITVINFAKQFKLTKVVIVGGKESYKVTQLLKQHHVSVMINRLHDLPELPEADVDALYKLPYLLQKDSILFCLQNQGDMEAMNARNIPFLAGTAAAYGLTKEQALQSITLNSAKIMGVDEQIGSIEVGKLASIIISDGDILDMKSNHVILAYLNGKQINLTNFQTDLYKKYSTKLNLKP